MGNNPSINPEDEENATKFRQHLKNKEDLMPKLEENVVPQRENFNNGMASSSNNINISPRRHSYENNPNLNNIPSKSNPNLNESPKNNKKNVNHHHRASSLNNNNNKKQASKMGIFSSNMMNSKNMLMSSAQSMVYISESSLSCFDNQIERVNVEIAKNILLDMRYDIHAIWICSRPVKRLQSAEHWIVKIHGGSCLIDIDFFEENGHGAFGISSTPASWAELDEFLHYFDRNDKTNEFIRKKWDIKAKILPPEFEQNLEDNHHNNFNHSDEQDLTKWISKCGNDHEYELPNIHKTINEIIYVIEEYYESRRVYNTVYSNCQRFAYELFKYVGNDNYADRVDELAKQFQSPSDIAEEQKKMKQREKNSRNSLSGSQKNNNISSNVINDSMDMKYNIDNNNNIISSNYIHGNEDIKIDEAQNEDESDDDSDDDDDNDNEEQKINDDDHDDHDMNNVNMNLQSIHNNNNNDNDNNNYIPIQNYNQHNKILI